MDFKETVSIIIPAYNAKDSICECIDSFLAQTYKDIEVICVDDGSKDNTYDILVGYSRKDSRVRAIHQENMHAGVARNNGMKNAVGTYLVFCDADDYVEPDYIEKLHDKIVADNADICLCGGKKLMCDTDTLYVAASILNPKHLPSVYPFNMHTHADYILNLATVAPWAKMFRRDFVEKTGLQYEDRRVGNDVYFVTSALCMAEKITVVEDPLVTYKSNQETSTTSMLSGNSCDPVDAWTNAMKYMKEHDCFPRRSFDNRVASLLARLVCNTKSYDDFKIFYDYLKSTGIKNLEITEHDKDYYYVEWHSDFIKMLLNGSMNDLLVFMCNTNYMANRDNSASRTARIQKLHDRNDKMKEKNEKLKNSVGRLEKQIDDYDVETEKLRRLNRRYEQDRKMLKAHPFKVFKWRKTI